MERRERKENKCFRPVITPTLFKAAKKQNFQKTCPSEKMFFAVNSRTEIMFNDNKEFVQK